MKDRPSNPASNPSSPAPAASRLSEKPSSRTSGLYARAAIASVDSTIDRARQFSEDAPASGSRTVRADLEVAAMVRRCLDLFDDFARALEELSPTAIETVMSSAYPDGSGDQASARWRIYAARHRTVIEHLALRRSAFAASARALLARTPAATAPDGTGRE
jgi:hypothetical protein